MWKTIWIAAAGLALAGGHTALGAERAELRVAFTTDRPAATSGLSLHVVYRDPDDPEGKAPALTKAAFTLPHGTRIDNAAVPQCMATDEELRASGRDACPEESRIGGGTLVATAGSPADPVHTDVTVFNGPGQIIELVTFEGTNQTAGFDRLTVEGSTLRAHPPFTPGGPPDGRTTIREVKITIPPRGALVTTPPSCPGRWQATGAFSFEGHPDTTVVAPMPCRREEAPPAGGAAGDPLTGPAASPAPRIRLRVTPRRARRGRRTTIRVVVTGPPACTAGATVRLRRARARTNTRGHATLRVRLRRSVTVRVTKRGCRPARARLRVIRPPAY